MVLAFSQGEMVLVLAETWPIKKQPIIEAVHYALPGVGLGWMMFLFFDCLGPVF